MKHKRYKVYCNDGDSNMSKVRDKVESILNDPVNEEYEIDKFEMVTQGTNWPYSFMLILKYAGNKPKIREIS